MAIQQTFTGTSGKTDYIITDFEFLKPGDIDITVGTATKTSPSDYSIEGSVIKFTSVPTVGATIKAERSTDISNKTHTYTPGSSITAQTLNDNQDQALFKIEEVAVDAVNAADLAGDHTGIHVSSNGNVWTINDDTIDGDHLKDNILEAKHIKPDAVGASELANDAVDTNAIVNLNVTTGKIANDAINGSKIADDSIDSEHIAADSIDAEHYAPGSVDATALASNAVTNVKVADDAIGIAELSATGTASTSTYLRGDNSWVNPIDDWLAGSTLETVTYICDGVSFTQRGVTYNSTAVTAAQTITTTYADVTGSTITYTPPTGTKKVIYEFTAVSSLLGSSQYPLWHSKLFLDGTEVTKARYTNFTYGDTKFTFKWAFPIGGTADEATGRVNTWGSAAAIKLQVRGYGGNYMGKLHETYHWDGVGGNSSTTYMFSLPMVTITAIS